MWQFCKWARLNKSFRELWSIVLVKEKKLLMYVINESNFKFFLPNDVKASLGNSQGMFWKSGNKFLTKKFFHQGVQEGV